MLNKTSFLNLLTSFFFGILVAALYFGFMTWLSFTPLLHGVGNSLWFLSPILQMFNFFLVLIVIPDKVLARWNIVDRKPPKNAIDFLLYSTPSTPKNWAFATGAILCSVLFIGYLVLQAFGVAMG
jgi:hypothetical protein